MSAPLTPGVHVVEPTDEECLVWDFHSLNPQFRIEFGCAEGCAHWEVVDPMPCYRHDRAVLEAELEKVIAKVPPKTEVTYVLAPHEALSRVNATSMEIHEWNHRESHEKEDRDTGYGHALVFMNGKRTPPHPAMTRYLAWHEYGHHVEDWIRRARKVKEEELRLQYADLRGLNPNENGWAGQRWHKAPGELLACDFRILVGQAETEFWPHPGVPRPTDPALLRWWQESIEMLNG